MTYTEFVRDNIEELLKQFPEPLFIQMLSELNKKNLEWLAKVPKRKGFVTQVSEVVMPMFKLLTEKSRAGIINAEMGTGKTSMSNLIAGLLYHNEYEDKGMNVLFLASGSKHENKMKREAKAIFGNLVDIHIIRLNPRRRRGEITIQEALAMEKVPGKINYFILSKDSGKNSFKSTAANDLSFCPKCGEGLTDKVRNLPKKDQIKLRLGVGGVPVKKAGKSIYACSSCGEKTWETNGGKRSIGEVVAASMKNKTDKKFDFMIVDEVHEMQNPNSLQTMLYKNISQASYRVLVMTGTLSNGYASSIFHILYPLFAKHFKEYGGFDYDKIGSFVDFFGFKQETTKVKIDSLGSKRKSTSISELPQINDRIVGFLAPYTVWFSIADLNIDMPEFTEAPIITDVDMQIKDRFTEWEHKVQNLKVCFNDPKLYQFKTALHYRVNNPSFPYVHEVEEYVEASEFKAPSYIPEGASIRFIEEENRYHIQASIPFEPLAEDFVSTKERALIKKLEEELAEGRRVIIYGLHDESISLHSRLLSILNASGIDADAMPTSLKSEDIEQWLIDYKKDVVIVPQKRVATGLDLVMFHTVIFYELDSQLRVVQQAKVRPWRPVGQTKDVRCFYLAFKGNQETALISMAQKMRAAATVEGKILTDDSIAALYDYNPTMTAAVAEITQRIQSGEFQYDDSEAVSRNSEMSEMEKYYQDLLDAQKEAEPEVEAKSEVVEDTEPECEEAEDASETVEENVAVVDDSVIEVANEEKDDDVEQIDVKNIPEEPANSNVELVAVRTVISARGQMAFVF